MSGDWAGKDNFPGKYVFVREKRGDSDGEKNECTKLHNPFALVLKVPPSQYIVKPFRKKKKSLTVPTGWGGSALMFVHMENARMTIS